MGEASKPFQAACAAALILALSGCASTSTAKAFQPIIDLHRHTPWPGDDDASALAEIRRDLRENGVVATVLFTTGREDLEVYRSNEHLRILLSPMFPCPALTADGKWCFTETGSLFPDPTWLDEELDAGRFVGIGELVFNYAAVAPDDPAMAPYWALVARHGGIAFVHSGRGPGPGQGPRRHPGCCPDYNAEFGDPALLRPILTRHPSLRLVLQHAGFDHLDETIALMRDFRHVYADMSVLNSVGPEDLHEASLRRIVDAGFADRLVFGSDDADLSLVTGRIEGADFLTPEQRRGIYYDNAARLLRFDEQTIAADYRRGG